MKFKEAKNRINFISTYDEVNLGDDLLLYAGIRRFQSNPKYKIFVNGKPIDIVFKKRKHKKSATHFERLSFFSQNIYFGGTNFLFPKDEKLFSKTIRSFYYIFLIFIFRIRLIANGIAFFPKIFLIFYKFCIGISARDYESLRILHFWNVNSTLEPDPVISLFKSNDEIFVDKAFLSNVNGVLILRSNFLSFECYKKKIDLILSKLDENKITHILFFQEGEVFEQEYDFDKLNIIVYDGSRESLNKIFNIIRSSSFVYSMRLHGLILAKLFHIKCFPIVIDEKLERNYVGLEDKVSI